MVSELSISFLVFTTPPPGGRCAGGTHPTGMHSCFRIECGVIEAVSVGS